MRKLAWVLLAVSLAAEHAVAEGRWVKEGATQQEITQDHYACLKESKRQGNAPAAEGETYRLGQLGIYAGPHTAAVRGKQLHGFSDPQPKTVSDVGLYRACVSARGYVWINS